MIFVFVWLISLTMIMSRSIHVAANGIISLFLWLSNIPLYMWYIYHIFFIHLSVDGHLGCFHILAIVNNSATNIGMHISFLISVFFPLDKYLEVRFLDWMVVLFLIFWGTSILFSIVAVSIYIPSNSAQGFQGLNILTNICYQVFFFLK